MQRIALIGAGFIGSVHAAALAANPDVDLVLVHDVDTARAEAVAGRHGSRAATRLEEVFDGEHVDAVLIASSTDTHTEHLRRAADAGVAALCEKPIDSDLSRAVDAVVQVEESGIAAMVGFNRRFDRANVELKRVVDAGEVGDVELVLMTNRGPVSPPLEYVAVSGGQLRDQTVHFFDLTRWLTGLHAGWFERVEPTYAASLAAFVAALEAGAPVPVPLREGLKAQAIAEAATASLTSGRTEEIHYP